jgi:tetratricopeptide (TPR) repeat protein
MKHAGVLIGLALLGAASMLPPRAAHGAMSKEDSPETLREIVEECLGGKAPETVLLNSCTLAIESGALPVDALAAAHVVRGVTERFMNLPDRATADFRRALEIKPDFVPALRSRADLLMMQRAHKEALADLERVVQLQPDLPEAYIRRGDQRDYLGDGDGALADYGRALALKPMAEAHDNRAVVLAKRSRFDEALADCDAAIGLEPGRAHSWYTRGRIKSQKGDFAGAAADLKKGGTIDGKDLYMLLAWAIAASRVGEDVKPELERRAAALELDAWPAPLVDMFRGRIAPDDVQPPQTPWPIERAGAMTEIHYYRGQFLLLQSRRDAAAAALKAAVDTGVVEYNEYQDAVAELARLNR